MISQRPKSVIWQESKIAQLRYVLCFYSGVLLKCISFEPWRVLTTPLRFLGFNPISTASLLPHSLRRTPARKQYMYRNAPSLPKLTSHRRSTSPTIHLRTWEVKLLCQNVHFCISFLFFSVHIFFSSIFFWVETCQTCRCRRAFTGPTQIRRFSFWHTPMLRFAALDASGFRMAQSPGRFRSENSRENSRGSAGIFSKGAILD